MPSDEADKGAGGPAASQPVVRFAMVSASAPISPKSEWNGARVVDGPVQVEERSDSVVRALDLDPLAAELLGRMLSAWREQIFDAVAGGGLVTVDGAPSADVPLAALPPSDAAGAARQAVRSALIKVAMARIDDRVRQGPTQELHHRSRTVFSCVDIPQWFFNGLEPPHSPDAGQQGLKPVSEIRFALSHSVARQLLGILEPSFPLPPRVIRSRLSPTAAALHEFVREHTGWRPVQADQGDVEFLDLPLTQEVWDHLGITASSEANRRRTLRRAVERLGSAMPQYSAEAGTLKQDGRVQIRIRRDA